MYLLRLAAYFLLYILFFQSYSAVGQSHPIQKQVFNQINNLEFTAEGKAVVLQGKGDFLIRVLNEKTYEVEQELVRRGNGPGELPKASSFYLDQEKNIIFLAGADRRIIGVSLLNGKTVYEKTFPKLKSISSSDFTPTMIIDDGYLFFSSKGGIDPSTPSDLPLPVVSLFDTSSTEQVFSFYLPVDDLAFRDLEDLGRANRVPLSASLVMLNERLSIVTFQGIPSFYFFVNGEFIKRVGLNPDFEVTFITSKRDIFGQKAGIRTPAYINNIEKLDEEHVLISYGNIHQEEIPMGYSVFRITSTPDLGLQDEIIVEKVLDKELPEIDEISAYNITAQQRILFLHNNFDWLAHQIYALEAPELNTMLDD
ncbi:hypothetical protein [Gracilimonas sp.]|uniref:hypothetical protein n=1 Tax=Gracilimonas sp. TaxID=1974203 RepID=UPI003BAD6D64